MLSWLMFVASGIGPYSGQAVHSVTSRRSLGGTVNRYTFEAQRHWDLEARLANKWMVGDACGIVDMAVGLVA